MGPEEVGAAYAAMSQQYIDAFDRVDPDDPDAALIRRHLTGLRGPVLDLGCGPGHWTAYLHGLGADVTGVDLVPEFVEHARAAHPGPAFRLASMAQLDVPAGSAAAILSWYSTIHLPPSDLDGVLAVFRLLLQASGVLVVGFFDSDDVVAPFDHAVTTAYRWPADAFADRLAAAGFHEVHRVRQQLAARPDRRYAAIVARAAT